MDLPTNRSCSFVVKVWVEERDEGQKHTHWRGHITHVLSGNRCYFENISTATEFVLPYLEAIGVTLEQRDLPGISRGI